ncbi:haloacid dehalogenase type II [Thalassospira sp. MA62]|nr:haloacid dehalogenase type II [Thalassospira sp. MA62]
MSNTQLPPCRAFVFDAYGTLFDVGSAVDKLHNSVGKDAESFSALWRQKQLEYTWLRSLMGDFADFWTVTGDALDYAMAQTGRQDALLRTKLMESYLALEPFADVAETLKALKSAGHKVAILSNGTKHMLISAAKTSGLLPLFDEIICVDDLEIYKPHRDVYQLAVDKLELQPAEIAFQSSNGWDIAGAKHFGFNTVWINRTNQAAEILSDGPDFTVNGLDALLPLIATDEAASA